MDKQEICIRQLPIYIAEALFDMFDLGRQLPSRHIHEC